MNSIRQQQDGAGDDEGVRRTLGHLLYAKSHQPILESDWAVLVASCAAQEPRALRALYERTHRLVYTLSVRIVGDRLAAEEVTLDVFLEVWRRARTYDPAQNTVVGWIMNLTRSRAIDRLRFDRRKKRAAPVAGDSAAEEVSPDDSVRTVETRDAGRMLQKALQALTAGERQAIDAAFFSELTYVEAAARLGQPVGTVKTRIRSGLAKLRHALSGRGDAP